jgi:hypothetical protein
MQKNPNMITSDSISITEKQYNKSLTVRIMSPKPLNNLMQHAKAKNYAIRSFTAHKLQQQQQHYASAITTKCSRN